MNTEDLIAESCGGASSEHRAITTSRHSADKPLEPDDFYFDRNNLMVFTVSYLKRRGYCCGNGCLHCPYPKQR